MGVVTTNPGLADKRRDQETATETTPNQTGARRARNRNRDRNDNETKTFKGETVKMNGHVFQLHAERKNKAQFTDTIETLQIFASTAYKSDIESMNVLFTELKTPEVEEPKGPKELIKTDKKESPPP